MSNAMHAADDGSLARSAGGALGRGILLLLLAVGIGVLLLAGTDQTAPADRLVAAAAAEDDGNSGGGTTGDATTSTTVTAPTAVAVPPRPPRDVKVLVANGTDVVGAGRNVTELLRPPGYNLISPVDATGPKVEATTVYFAAGYAPEAGAMAQVLEAPATAVKEMPAEVPVRALNDANVLVVVGAELAGRTAVTTTTTTTTARSAATTTTTARAGATTTTR